MTTVKSILLVIHLLGFAALFGGLLVQAKEPVKKVNGPMRDGIGTAFVIGLALFGIDSADDPAPGSEWHWKMTVKLVVGLVILVAVMMNLRKESISKGLWGTLLLLTVGNVCVAAIWHAS
ncbi:hypothetical protein [Nocardioides sp. KR10-350]|uniref:hypothetical protein n=1 Tax=Nocardioides cheoyonin TaxID=3156615 RepID=UPI0032B4B764